MSAQHDDSWYEALEARVADLEQQTRHVIPPKIDAVSYGVSIMHEDVRDIRLTQADHTLTLADHTDQLASIAETLTAHGGQLAAIGEGQRQQAEQLAEIIRRLPEPPADQ